MNKKSGLTLSSILIYVTLFFIFTVFAISMSTNMSYKSMEEKANIYIHEQFDKLQYNMLDSSKKSNNVEEIFGKIVFSNDDEYVYDAKEKQILKNDSVLIDNVEEYKIITLNDLENIPDIYISNINKKSSNICLEITFKKYGKQITKELVITPGDE